MCTTDELAVLLTWVRDGPEVSRARRAATAEFDSERIRSINPKLCVPLFWRAWNALDGDDRVLLEEWWGLDGRTVLPLEERAAAHGADPEQHRLASTAAMQSFCDALGDLHAYQARAAIRDFPTETASLAQRLAAPRRRAA